MGRWRPRLLVVDDKPNFLALFRRIVGEEMEVLTASDAAEALALLGRERVDVVVSDVKMPGLSGIELLARLRTRHPDTEVILMTAFGHVPDAVSAIKAGAFHYLTKPFDPDAALRVIREAIARRPSIAARPTGRPDEPFFIASSAAMQSVLEVLARTAAQEVHVLITGHLGTGKERVAKEIHARSSRQGGPLIRLDCRRSEAASDVELDSLLRRAAGGTLYFDEISELSLALQTKVVEALAERVARQSSGRSCEPLGARVVAATSADISALVAEGRFSAQLFYMLNLATIRVPALRERRDDIGPLAIGFLARASSPDGTPRTFSPAAHAVLEAFDWPGNVGQLENTVARAASFSSAAEVGVDALPPEITHSVRLQPAVDLAALAYRDVLSHSRDASSKEYFIALLRAVQGNVTQAAERAGIHRESLHRLLKRYGLRAEDFRAR